MTTMKSVPFISQLGQPNAQGAVGADDKGLGIVGLSELVAIIKRRKWLIGGTVSVIMAGAVFAIISLTERFEATAEVLIEPAKNQFNPTLITEGLDTATETIQSQIQIIQSRKLIGRVVDKLDLGSHFEFSDAPKESALAGLLPESVRGVLTFGGDDAVDITSAADRRNRLVTDFLKRLKVGTAGRSRVIEVTFESEDKVLAALAANTVADLYIVDHLESRFEAIQGATNWLNTRVADLRKKLTESEEALNAFRAQQGIISGADDASILRSQISDVSTELSSARSALAEAQSRAALVERARNSAAGVAALPDVLQSNVILDLNTQVIEIDSRMAQATAEFGPRHPVMVNLQAERTSVQARMQAEIDRVIAGIRNEASLAQSRVDALNQTLSALDAEISSHSGAQIQLDALRSEVESNRLLYQNFLDQMNTAGASDFVQSNARIISPAEVPGRASFPNRKLLAVASLGLALGFALTLAFGVELLEGGFRSADEIEKAFGVSGLGLVPEVRSMPGFKRVLEEVVLDNPLSHYAEALRRLYTTVLLHDGDPGQSSIVFTSAMPGEGKTTMVAAMGRVVAALGRKVVVIDCDFRRPRLHRALGDDGNGRGLMQLLLDNDSIDSVLNEDTRSGLHYIKAGTDFVRPMNLLESPRFREILDELRARYDIVLIDAPPILAVADGLLLAARADQTVVVAKWQSTQRAAVGATIKQVAEAGGNVAGVVLNQVNVAKNAGYNYGDSMLYTKQFSKYYTS